MVELIPDEPINCTGGAPAQSYRAGRALVLLNFVRDSRRLQLDAKVFEHLLHGGWIRSEVQQAIDDIVKAASIRINATSQITLELEATA